MYFLHGYSPSARQMYLTQARKIITSLPIGPGQYVEYLFHT
jgi:hypothetical protein